jgi:hypothetical protein
MQKHAEIRLFRLLPAAVSGALRGEMMEAAGTGAENARIP